MLPSYANRDARLQIAPRAGAFINAVQDQAHMEMCKRNVQKKPSDVLHNGTTLTGALSGEQYKVYESEPVAVYKQSATTLNIQRFGGARPGFRGGIVQETRVPVVFNANGIVASTAWEVDKKLSILGFSDIAGRDNRTHDLNVQIGGTRTVCVSGPESILLGDYVMARTPTRDETKLIQFRAGNMANRNGRVPLILVPLRPETVNVYNRPEFVKAMEKLDFDGNTNQYSIRPNAIANDSYPVVLFTESVRDMANAFMAAFGFVRRENLNDALRDADSDFMKRHVFAFAVANMRLVLDLCSRCVGRAQLAGESGHDIDLFIGAYCR